MKPLKHKFRAYLMMDGGDSKEVSILRAKICVFIIQNLVLIRLHKH